MSFGGGGGSTGVTNHTHTNAAGEGGALDENSLLNNDTILGLCVTM